MFELSDQKFEPLADPDFISGCPHSIAETKAALLPIDGFRHVGGDVKWAEFKPSVQRKIALRRG